MIVARHIIDLNAHAWIEDKRVISMQSLCDLEHIAYDPSLNYQHREHGNNLFPLFYATPRGTLVFHLPTDASLVDCDACLLLLLEGDPGTKKERIP